MNERIIDKTHIIVLKEENGLLRNMELSIARPEQIIAEIKAMKDNPNRTVWDMQSLFTNHFPKTDSCLDYLYPDSYSSYYVDCVHYPNLLSYEYLKKSWEEARCAARESYYASCKANELVPNESTANLEESKAIENINKLQKGEFLRKALLWINASCYYQTASKLNCDSSVKMYSKENIGWSSFVHQINDDIKIAIKTNFGFGSAAYFFMAVQYKGIDILPYSSIVKYYYVGMTDIVRCTRSYRPCRDSWSASFDFLTDFVNKSMSNPEHFVKSYIMHEVAEMMRGLEAIAVNPKAFIEQIGSRHADPCIINIRHMFNEERTRMRAYPEETPILFKVKKITDALDFLSNLSEISKEVKDVQPHIDRLLEINISLYPEILNTIAKINSKIDEKYVAKSKYVAQIDDLSKDLVPFEEEISRLKKEATQDRPFIMDNYETEHTMYLQLKAQKNNLQSKVYMISCIIDDLNSFLNFLNQAVKKLDKIKVPLYAA